MLSTIFSIPLQRDVDPADVVTTTPDAPAPGEKHYIGSHENRLVQVALHELLVGPPAMSPYVLFGPTGTGKSLLARGAIGRWQVIRPDSPALFFTGADFGRAFAQAVDTAAVSDFRRRCRQAGLLVIDDLHQLARKHPAQNELIVILDELLDAGGSVLVTLPQSPVACPDLVVALRSRLAGGLAVPLVAPGADARHLLLRQAAAEQELELTEDAAQLLTEQLAGAADVIRTVPELNRAVRQLRFLTSGVTRVVDLQHVRDMLARQNPLPPARLRDICQLAARHFGLSLEALRSTSRRRNLVRGRGVTMLLCRQLLGSSYGAIGRYFGGRDHTTVLHACRKTNQLQGNDSEIATALHELTEQASMNFRIQRPAGDA